MVGGLSEVKARSHAARNYGVAPGARELAPELFDSLSNAPPIIQQARSTWTPKATLIQGLSGWPAGSVRQFGNVGFAVQATAA